VTKRKRLQLDSGSAADSSWEKELITIRMYIQKKRRRVMSGNDLNLGEFKDEDPK
jgi:hypothetical protein